MSDNITLELSGLNAVFSNLDKLGPAFESHIQETIKYYTNMARREAQDKVPVKTGALRKSAKVEFGHLSSTLTFTGNDDHPYALYVEKGHHTKSGEFIVPRLFLTPAFYHNADRMLKVMENIQALAMGEL